MKKEPTSEFMELYNMWKDHYKELDVDYKNYLVNKSKMIDLHVRIDKNLDAKTLHPLPKNK
jgi:hypothetical protein